MLEGVVFEELLVEVIRYFLLEVSISLCGGGIEEWRDGGVGNGKKFLRRN